MRRDLPERPFEAYVPDERWPWDRRRVNHLLRRLAFGPRPADVELAKSGGPAEAIARQFSYDPEVDPFADLYEQTRGLLPMDNYDRCREWWCNRLIRTQYPLQEKLALFWHNHFATAGSKVNPAWRMTKQIDLFRRLGRGSFRTLLVEVGRDPAMLQWLDGQTSTKNGPNENYAREVMELFTLGPGHYTEWDVKELSRCFTGWRIEGEGSRFDASRHDAGEKTVLGQTGKFNDEQAIDILLQQPMAARFVARKLLVEFLHPNPESSIVDHYAGRLRAHDWNIEATLREIVSSRVFFSDYAYRSRIKSPAELLVGAVYALDCGANAAFLRDQLARMGQNLLFPPDVSGWDGQEAWINSNTLVQRYNFALQLVRQQEDQFFQRVNLNVYVRDNKLQGADLVVDQFSDRLLDGPLPEAERSMLIDYMNLDEKNNARPFEGKGDQVRQKVRGAIHLLMCRPAFQLG